MDLGTQYPGINEILSVLLERWPAHSGYVAKSFKDRPPEVMRATEELARAVLALAASNDAGLAEIADDYRFLCESIILPEELYFRRHGAYRLSKFADAERECYANAPFMHRYMNGVMLSNVLWSNHSHAFSAYVNDYLPSLSPGASHLEIGPGHGLFLSFAAHCPNVSLVEGWDVSPTSIANTRAALDTLGAPHSVKLTLADMFDTSPKSAGESFDSLVMSEILEHLEDPVAALRAAFRQLKPGGRIWVNLPANSPCPDHIFLVHGLDHACELVRTADFEIVSAIAYPMSGVTLEKALKNKLTISCVITAVKPLDAKPMA